MEIWRFPQLGVINVTLWVMLNLQTVTRGKNKLKIKKKIKNPSPDMNELFWQAEISCFTVISA